MPIVVSSSTRSADALINYALEDKPDQKGERYVMASGGGGLLVSVAKQQMRDVRKKWRKDKPGAFIQAYHVIQSFAKDELDPDDPDAWMTAQKLGSALAEDRFPGRQVLVVTQRDGQTGCVHNHIVANSVDTKTGRSLNSSVVMHARLVEAHERVLEEHGFEQRADLKQAFSDATERRERGERSGLREAGTNANSELREFHNYVLWETECDLAAEFGGSRRKEPFSVAVLKVRIERALADLDVVDWDSFVEVGGRSGVLIEQRGGKGRGISYGMLREEPDGSLAVPSTSDRRRCGTLGSEFQMDAVERAFDRNASDRRFGSISAETGSLSTNEAVSLALVEAVEPVEKQTGCVIVDAALSKGSETLVEESTASSTPPNVPGTVGLSELRRAQPFVEETEESTLQPSDGETATVENRTGTRTLPVGRSPRWEEHPNAQARKTSRLHVRFPELDDATHGFDREDRAFGE